MSLTKKISAVSLSAALALSLASCSLGGPDTTYGAVIDGYKVPAGVFITEQMNAYYDALSREDDNADSSAAESSGEEGSETVTTPFTDKVIDSKPVRDWINDEATKNMQRFVAIENKFKEMGLAIDSGRKEQITLYVDSIWEYYGQMYEDMGVSEDSQLLISLNTEKRSLIFDSLYGEGGSMAVSESELKNYLSENNARINYIKMELKDGEGNLLKSEGKDEIRAKADDYISRAQNGEEFTSLIKEYNDYYKNLVAEANKDSEESTEETTETEESNDNTRVVAKTASYPDANMIAKAFDGSAKQGDVFFVESSDGEAYYVVQLLDLYADEDYFDNNKSTALHSLKDDEFEAQIESWMNAQKVERNEAAYKRYKIEKIMD